jgi:hypothetical protein
MPIPRGSAAAAAKPIQASPCASAIVEFVELLASTVERQAVYSNPTNYTLSTSHLIPSIITKHVLRRVSCTALIQDPDHILKRANLACEARWKSKQ